MPTLTREEFEARWVDISSRVTRLENQLEKQVEDIQLDVKETQKQIQALIDLVNSSRITIWKFLAMLTANVLVSGSVFSILIGTGHIH